MTETLSARFAANTGAPVHLDGKVVVPIYSVEVSAKRRGFTIHRQHAADSPVPGLSLQARTGEIEVNGRRSSHIVLWADTSPQRVDLAVLSGSGCTLNVWNVWRNGDSMDAWLGNAGMVVTQGDGVTTLECSSGPGDVDFSDLVVDIERGET